MLVPTNDDAIPNQTFDYLPYHLSILTLAGSPVVPSVNEVVVGTRVSAGMDATGKVVGAVYVFQYSAAPSPHFTQVRSTGWRCLVR